MIKAVLFDVGGVLTRPIGGVFLERAAAAGLDPKAVKAAMWAAFAAEGDTDEPAHRLERGEISVDEFLSSMGDNEATARALMHPDSPHFVPAGFKPHEGMHAFVREVSERGLLTGLVSNVVEEWMGWWEAVSPPGELFDVQVMSCRVGMRKPNAAIYRYAMDQLSVAPEETLFLDDFAAMADAARALGMVVVHVEDHDTAIAEARRHLDRNGG